MATKYILLSLSLVIALSVARSGYSQGESGPNPDIDLIISASPNNNSPYVHKGCSIDLSATMTHAVGEGSFTASITSGSGTITPTTLSTSTTSAQTLTLTGNEVGTITVEIDYSPPAESGLNDPEPVTVNITCFTYSIVDASESYWYCDGSPVKFTLSTNPASAGQAALSTLDGISAYTEPDQTPASPANPSGETELSLTQQPSTSNDFTGRYAKRLWYALASPVSCGQTEATHRLFVDAQFNGTSVSAIVGENDYLLISAQIQLGGLDCGVSGSGDITSTATNWFSGQEDRNYVDAGDDGIDVKVSVSLGSLIRNLEAHYNAGGPSGSAFIELVEAEEQRHVEQFENNAIDNNIFTDEKVYHLPDVINAVNNSIQHKTYDTTADADADVNRVLAAELAEELEKSNTTAANTSSDFRCRIEAACKAYVESVKGNLFFLRMECSYTNC